MASTSAPVSRIQASRLLSEIRALEADPTPGIILRPTTEDMKRFDAGKLYVLTSKDKILVVYGVIRPLGATGRLR